MKQYFVDFQFLIKFCLGLMIWLFGYSAQAGSSLELTPERAQLQLTHFLFTQVIESFLEEGDRFVIESPFGNGERSFEYLLEKKFLIALLKEWQAELAKPDQSYHSSFEVFKIILNRSSFLKLNSFYLTTTLGLNSKLDGQMDHHLIKAGLESWNVTGANSVHELVLKNGLNPFQKYPVNLGYARVSLLQRVLATERIKNGEERSLAILEDLARFMAYEREDRKTILWMTAFFLRNPSDRVAKKAEAIIAAVDQNEVVDFLADARWFIVGGRYLWTLRDGALGWLNRLGQTRAGELLQQWVRHLSLPVAKHAIRIKDKMILTSMSMYRYLKANAPVITSGAISISAHSAFYKYFVKSSVEKSDLSPLQRDLQEAIKDLGMETTSEFVLGSNSAPDSLDKALKTYGNNSPYKELRKFDSAPLELYNVAESVEIQSKDELALLAQKRLSHKSKEFSLDFDYAQYFLTSEYYRSLATTRVRDLRLISLAQKVINERVSEFQGSITALNKKTLNELSYEQIREILRQQFDTLRKHHFFYYSRDSRSLIRESLGEGGNCVAVAFLQIATLASNWGQGDWKLGIVFQPQHVLVVAFSEKVNTLIELDSFKEKRLADYPSEIYHPDLFIAASLGLTMAQDFIVYRPRSSTHLGEVSSQALNQWGLVDSTSKEDSNGLFSQMNSLKETWKNSINNPIKDILGIKVNGGESNQEEIPQFALNENADSTRSAEGDLTKQKWKNELGAILQQVLNKPNLEQGVAGRNEWDRWTARFYRELGVTVIKSRPLDSIKERGSIPLVGGKMGQFTFRSSSSGEASKVLTLILTKEMASTIVQVEPQLFFKLILMSLQKEGEKLGRDLLSDKINSMTTLYLKAASDAPNAGDVTSNNQGRELNQWFHYVKALRLNIEGLIGKKEGPASSVSDQAYAQRIREFAKIIGYPGTTWVIEDQGVNRAETTSNYNVDVFLQVLLRGQQFDALKPLSMGEFQKKFLFDNLALTSNPSVPQSLYEKKVRVDQNLMSRPTTGDQSDWLIQVFENGEWVLDGSLFSRTENEKNDFRFLRYLESDPRLVRANLLLPEVPLSNSLNLDQREMVRFIVPIIEWQTDFWSFDLPEISETPCVPLKRKTSVTVDLPQISKEMCDQFRNNSQGIVCTPKDENKDLGDLEDNSNHKPLPICLSGQTTQFRVVYHKNKVQTSTGSSHQIPFENFLSLISSMRPIGVEGIDKKELFDMGHNSCEGPEKVVTLTSLNKLLERGKFTQPLVQHLIKQKSYYQDAWSFEMGYLCGLLKLADAESKSKNADYYGSSSIEVGLHDIADDRYYYSKAQYNRTYFPLPREGGGSPSKPLSVYHQLVKGGACTELKGHSDGPASAASNISSDVTELEPITVTPSN